MVSLLRRIKYCLNKTLILLHIHEKNTFVEWPKEFCYLIIISSTRQDDNVKSFDILIAVSFSVVWIKWIGTQYCDKQSKKIVSAHQYHFTILVFSKILLKYCRNFFYSRWYDISSTRVIMLVFWTCTRMFGQVKSCVVVGMLQWLMMSEYIDKEVEEFLCSCGLCKNIYLTLLIKETSFRQ